jgi:hypothetical protein
MRRPSPALVLSIIAIVIACAGSAGAAVLITSKDIKDHSIRGKDVRSNSITGRNVKGLSGRDVIRNGLDGSDIDENTLDTVPNATRAVTAGTAASADSVKGLHVTKVAFRAPLSTAGTTIFDEGGLKVSAACSAAGVLNAAATPSGTDGVLRLSITHPGAPPETTYVVDNAFTGTDSANLVAGGTDNLQGRLTYTSAAGDNVTIEYLTQDGVDPAGGYVCLVAGTAVHTAP